MIFHKFPWFSCISQDFGPAALVRKKDSNSYAFSMVAVLIFLPGHSKISFSMKILVPNQNFGDFHEICWILGAESDFIGFEGSLAGPGGKPWYSYRNIKVSEPPRTTTITPKQRNSQSFHWNHFFAVQNWFCRPWTSKNGPRTLRLCRVSGRCRQCRFWVSQVRFWCPES